MEDPDLSKRSKTNTPISIHGFAKLPDIILQQFILGTYLKKIGTIKDLLNLRRVDKTLYPLHGIF
jgi:hypothetical protein